MCPSETAVVQTLEQIVRRFAPRHRSEIPLTSQTRLVEDAGIDSPRMIDIVIEIEDRLGITIEDDEAQKVATFGDLVQFVEARTAGGQ